MYSYKEAVYLVDYYKDKVIGKPIIPSSKKLIDLVEVENRNNDSYSVKCVVTEQKGANLFRDIHAISKELELTEPKAVLSQWEGNGA
ncbi:hypothetical protein GN157_12035 [Flavobacterium rakeshii]|uniref:Uncharacterized protein n=1 Tax=Flavobacterium rakeshii TaxID=1038845 RepID=A0A6N8HFE5_9FLAO|nr:hypothetical protein [Flavobacterium rakeshii]MUV04439.1 hypothetical protein [Flavobacterium rakeshii]